MKKSPFIREPRVTWRNSVEGKERDRERGEASGGLKKQRHDMTWLMFVITRCHRENSSLVDAAERWPSCKEGVSLPPAAKGGFGGKCGCYFYSSSPPSFSRSSLPPSLRSQNTIPALVLGYHVPIRGEDNSNNRSLPAALMVRVG